MDKKMTYDEWMAEGTRLFGPDQQTWRFVCPVCKHVATPADWKAAGASEGAIGFSCVGRWGPNPRDAFERGKKPGPCNYAGGGLFRLNPVTVTAPDGSEHQMFAFEEPAPAQAQAHG